MPAVRETPPYLLDPYERAMAHYIRHNAALSWGMPYQRREMERALWRYWERKAREAARREKP